MKKFIICWAVCLTCCAIAYDANRMFYVNILPADKETGPTTVTGSAVDVAAYKGNGTFVVNIGDGAAAATNVVTITHCATSGGSYTTVTNLAGTAGVITHNGTTNSLDTFACDLSRLHKYVKAKYTTTGTNSAVSVILVAPMKSN